MASETERTKMATTQRAAPSPEGEVGQLWALMFLPILSIILGFSCRSLTVINTDRAKVEVAGLGAAWVMVQAWVSASQ